MIEAVLAANPAIALGGQIAAIVICLYIFVFVLIALGFNIAMAFVLAWLRQKVNLLKMLRPAVESVNQSAEAVTRGAVPATTNQNAIVRTAATVPARVQSVDKKVDQLSERVTGAMIEVRARTVQARTIVKAFFLPGLMQHRSRPARGEDDLAPERSGYQAPEQGSLAASAGDERAQAVEVGQLKDVPAR